MAPGHEHTVPSTRPLRSVDRDVLLAMQGRDAVSVEELTETLGVTATAVRQRIDRLLDQELVDRQKVISGRGRPVFRYRITQSGGHATGADPSRLVTAMWQVFVQIEDQGVRDTILQSVADNLGQQYAAAIGSLQLENEDMPLDSKLRALVSVMTGQDIVAEASSRGDLPTLDIVACPYPALAEASADRQMCQLEERVLSAALGQPVGLTACRLDGDSCCQFEAKSAAGTSSKG